MKKGSFVSDTFEQLAELGQSGKKAAKPLAQMPGKVVETVFGVQPAADSAMEEIEKGRNTKKKHTPLDFQKLQKKYGDQDALKTDELRNRLFQLVKSGEEKTVMQKRQDELEKKRKATHEEQDKKRKEDEKKKQQQIGNIPQGRIRRSIFSPKKMAKREQAEVRPATGKQ